MAKFIKPFRGVPEGEIYPVQFVTGDECPAELVAGALSVGALSVVASRPPAPSLLGSSILPAQVKLIDGVSVQLGTVVSHAQEASGLSAEDWNALDEGSREAALAASIAQLTAEAEAAASKSDAGADQAGQKADLIKRLEAASIQFDKRWGVEKLTAALAEGKKE